MKKHPGQRTYHAFTLVELMLALGVIAIVTAMTVGVLSSGIFSWQKGRAEWDRNLRRHNVADALRRDISSMLPAYKISIGDDRFVLRFLGDGGDEAATGNAEPLFLGEKDRIGFAVSREYFGGSDKLGAMWVEFYIDKDESPARKGLVMRRVPLLFLFKTEEKEKEEIIQLDSEVKDIAFEYSGVESDEDRTVNDSVRYKIPRSVKLKLDYGTEKREMEIKVRAGHPVTINPKGKEL